MGGRHRKEEELILPRHDVVLFFSHCLYVDAMDETNFEKLRNRVLLSVIEHDHSRVWLLHDDNTDPVVTVHRPGSRQMHVRSSQERHMHSTETGEAEYFATLANVLGVASEVLLIGHGKGNGNMMNKFMKYLENGSSAHVHVTASGNADLSAMSDGELLKEARRRWDARLNQ